MNRPSDDDISYERKLRLKRKLIWGILSLFIGGVTLLLSVGWSIWLYRYNGRISVRVALIALAGGYAVYRGIKTLVKGEQEDTDEDIINPLF